MTDSLEKAIAVTRALPPDRQDDLARLMMLYAGQDGDDPVCALTPDEEAALRIGIEQADRGQLATDEQVRATWAKYDR